MYLAIHKFYIIFKIVMNSLKNEMYINSFAITENYKSLIKKVIMNSIIRVISRFSTKNKIPRPRDPTMPESF